MAWRREYVGIAFLPSRSRKQPIGLLAYGLGHSASLAVGPNDAAVFQTNPFLFECDDFATAGGELELQPDRQRLHYFLHNS